LEKQNSPSFSDFPDPPNSFYQTTIRCKHDLTNYLSSQFGSFRAQLQNSLFKEHGDWLHPHQSLCHPGKLHNCHYALNSNVQQIHLVSYSSKVAFKSVDNTCYTVTLIDWLSRVLRLHQHNIGYTADGF